MKKSKAEKTIEKAMESFMMYQRNADEEYQKREEDRRQRESWKKREGVKIASTT